MVFADPIKRVIGNLGTPPKEQPPRKLSGTGTVQRGQSGERRNLCVHRRGSCARLACTQTGKEVGAKLSGTVTDGAGLTDGHVMSAATLVTEFINTCPI